MWDIFSFFLVKVLCGEPIPLRLRSTQHYSFFLLFLPYAEQEAEDRKLIDLAAISPLLIFPPYKINAKLMFKMAGKGER